MSVQKPAYLLFLHVFLSFSRIIREITFPNQGGQCVIYYTSSQKLLNNHQ